MKHIISYSGGAGSAITAKIICDKYGKENVTLLFADTKVESKDQYRFTQDVIKFIGCEFISISDGRTPWEVFNDVRFIGNTRIDPCSRILKRDLIRDYLNKNYDPSCVTIWIGIDASESHRLAPVVSKNLPFVYRSILIEEDIFLSPAQKIAWCVDNNIKPSIMYEMGFSHDNCGGFCVKAGLGQFKKLFELLPEVYEYNEKEEQTAMYKNPNLRPFLRKTINGKLTYITMKEYRESYLETNNVTDDESMEFGGCGCAL